MPPLLNIPPGLSPIDDFVLRHIPRLSQSGIIVNAGTDRLSKTIRESLGASVSVYNIEPRTPLFNLLEKDEFRASDPWDLDWYTKIAEKHKGLDFIFFLNIHEYWQGNLLSLQNILKLLKPKGIGFMSFYNKNSLYEIRQTIPPFMVGIEQLGAPMNNWAKLDLASWMIYLTDIGFPLTHVWGMLEDDAFNYCNQPNRKETLWKSKDLNVEVRDASDAYILGAPVMCMQFQPMSSEIFTIPQFLGVQYNASMLQSILFPYLSILPNETEIFGAHLEIDNHLHAEKESLVLLNFFVSQLEEFKDVKTVLVVGCNWGIDLLVLKKLKPDWKITGIDKSEEIISSGAKLMKKEGIDTFIYNTDGSLPFADSSFDLVISLKYFSHIYRPLAELLAKDMLRVSKQGIAQLEDLRGPDLSMQLKLYSIPSVYTKLNQDPEVRSIKIEDKNSGLYILKIKKQTPS